MMFYKRKEREIGYRDQIHREERLVKTEAEIRVIVYKPRNFKHCLHPSETEKRYGIDCPSEPLKGANTDNTLIPGF